MAIQQKLGADIAMAFDVCSPYPCDHSTARDAMDRTHRWAERCLKSHTRPDQALFGIVQGAFDKDLRIQSVKTLRDMDFPGYGIGGLSVGEPKALMYEMLDAMQPHYAPDKPRYLMGVGTPANMLEAIDRGVDMFDCIMPTRNGRNGQLFTKNGIMNMRNQKWKNDFSPIEEDGASFVDTRYSKAYLRHLFNTGEILALQIASIHNLAFYLWLVKEARWQILQNNFPAWKASMIDTIMRRL